MITVNQRDHIPWHKGLTVSDLLDRLKYTFPHVVITIDGTLVAHDTYATTSVPDDADVRIIHLMAGG